VSGETFETLNPATEEVLSDVAHGQAEDINRAVKAARRAFDDDSPWRRMNASDRGRMIWKISELIEENADELAMLESLDNGKPYQIAKAADVALAADLFRYMAGWPTKIEGTTVPISALPAPGEYLAYTLREPVGVVGQIIPWNFPLLMAAWKLGPVLACGCTVVLKPAEQTPLSALRLGELLQEAGLPDGVVNIVTGFGDAGAALAAHDDVDKVAFTGSTEVGKLIVKAAAGNLKKVTLELGGKSPNVVYADADLESAIAGAANGIFFNHGQCCNAGSRLYVQKGVFDDVVAGVADALPGLRPQRRRRCGHRRWPSGRPRLLRVADGSHQHEPGHERRPRGDLRARGVRDPVRLPRGDRSDRQQHQLRARRGRVHPGHLQGPPDRQAAPGRHRVDQHLPRVRCRDAVRRLQGVRLGTGDGLSGPQQLPRDQVGRHRPLRYVATARPAQSTSSSRAGERRPAPSAPPTAAAA